MRGKGIVDGGVGGAVVAILNANPHYRCLPVIRRVLEGSPYQYSFAR